MTSNRSLIMRGPKLFPGIKSCKSIIVASSTFISTKQSLRHIDKKKDEVTNMLQLLQSKLLDLEKEKISLDERMVKEQELLNRLQSEASRVNKNLQSSEQDLETIAADSSFYQEQRSQYLASLDFKLRDHIFLLIFFFPECLLL